MSDIITEGIIEKRRLVAFCETFAANPPNMDGPLIAEAKIHFDDSGIHATAVDAANVAMVGPATLSPRGLESYESIGQAVMGVNLTALVDRLKPASPGDLVKFEIDMETRHMRLSYGAANVAMALIDPDLVRQEPDIPDLDLPNTVVLDGSRLDYAVEVSEMVSDHVFVEGHPDDRQVVFRGPGDTDDATVEYGDDETLDGTNVVEECDSVFSAGYLQAVTKPIPNDAEVTIQFGDDWPLRLSWQAFDGAFDVRQNLAPRIQTK